MLIFLEQSWILTDGNSANGQQYGQKVLVLNVLVSTPSRAKAWAMYNWHEWVTILKEVVYDSTQQFSRAQVISRILKVGEYIMG